MQNGRSPSAPTWNRAAEARTSAARGAALRRLLEELVEVLVAVALLELLAGIEPQRGRVVGEAEVGIGEAPDHLLDFPGGAGGAHRAVSDVGELTAGELLAVRALLAAVVAFAVGRGDRCGVAGHDRAG